MAYASPEDVAAKCDGLVRFKAQRRALDRLGIRYTLSGKGRPLVHQDDLDGGARPRAESDAHWTRVVIRDEHRERMRAKLWQPKPLAIIVAGRREYKGYAPAVSGVYFLFDGDELVYIGRSFVIADRLVQHRRRGRRFDGFAYDPCPSALMAEAEVHYIREARPAQNVANNVRNID